MRLKSLVLISVLAALSAFGQSNKTTWIDPANCSGTATTLAITANGQVRAAAGNGAIRFFTTDNAGGTVAVNCDLSSAFANRIGSSARITSVEFFYGVQTTAISSIATAVVSFVQLATSGAAAAGTVSTAGGSLTVTPAVLQLTTTTTGQCFNEKVSMGTPIAARDARRVTFEQVFTFGMAISTLQICGIQVNYTDTP
jgi:hypothetical protein